MQNVLMCILPFQAGDNIPAVTLYVVNVFSPAHTLRMTAPVSLKNRYCRYTFKSVYLFSPYVNRFSRPKSRCFSLLSVCLPVSRGHYISMVKWTSGTRLVVRWLNRVQNQSVLSVCEATTGVCSQVIH